MMTAIVKVFAAFRLVVAEENMITMHMHSLTMKVDVIELEPTGRRYKQVDAFVCLGSNIKSRGDVIYEIHSRDDQAQTCLYKYSKGVLVKPYIPLTTNILSPEG